LDTARHDTKNAGRVTLAVSGDAALLEVIRATLEGHSQQVLTLDSGLDVPARAKARQPVLILIDSDQIDAVDIDGTRVLETLKASPYTSALPVVVVLPTGSGEPAQLEALRRGAEDCLVRPESGELLGARLLALARRYVPPQDADETLTVGGLTLDLRARKVMVNSTLVALTRKEFDLLYMLLRRRGVVVYTTHLYHSVWGYGDSSPVDSHTVKVHISSLRSKLGAKLGRKIVNLPGLGYRFDE
jgi:two-component system alkaline phosphatase synthesis response regulator PhoP